MNSLLRWRLGLPLVALSSGLLLWQHKIGAEEQTAVEQTAVEQTTANPTAANQTAAADPHAAVAAADDKVDFQTDIRPILSNSCFHCHGPDEQHQEAGLRFDVREVAIGEAESGAIAIVPGQPDESEMIARISSDDEFMQMPPPESGKTALSPEQIALFKKWIAQGAEYQEHWAFVAPQQPSPPEVKQADWVRNPIDRFILARLEKEQLAPSPEADKTTLIRRVTYDLTGLPPTPAEVDAFLADESPDAYEKLVDRLLASPRHGEHRARYWLDIARYGDTHGLHLDNYREIWPYRDWVIDAFNSNMPFDQFTVEQLAGDMLPEATLDQKIATGFVRCHVSTNEGGSIAEEVYVRNIVDRVETFGTVFMGMTTGCAMCHDHKYDPISQQDFFSLFAFFNSSAENPMDGNKKDWAPVVTVPDRQVKQRLEEVERQIAATQKQLDDHSAGMEPEFAAWLAEQQTAAAQQSEAERPLPAGLLAHFPLDEGQGDTAAAATGDAAGKWEGQAKWIDGKFGKAVQFDGGTINAGNVGDFEREQSFSYGGWLNFHGKPPSGGLIAKMHPGQRHRGWDIFSDSGRIAMHLIHTWPDSALKVTARQPSPSDGWHHVFITYDGGSRAAGVTIYIDGEPVDFNVDNDTLAHSMRVDVPLRFGGRHGETSRGFSLDDVRLYERELSQTEVRQVMGYDPVGEWLRIPADQRTAEQVEGLRDHYRATVDPRYRELRQQLRQWTSEKADLENESKATTLVMQELPKPKPAYLLDRGEYDKRKEEVPRAVPGFLPPLPEGQPVNRLGLARWLLAPEHPLFARVTVNRFWQQYFGTGIVETSEDFGSQGAVPSHPALLDWLAVHFRESGWDAKAMQKLIVTSATYRQASNITPQSYERDPENRLLARGPRYRLDAEVIRDTMLAAGGLLVERIGGPSVKPYQPSGVWEAVGYSGSNTVRFKRDSGDALYRRSLYTFWKRTAPPPGMKVFDAPSRETCSVRRSRTNSPTAALNLMNDEQYVEAARQFAARVVAEGGDDLDSRLRYAFRLCTARTPSEPELKIMAETYRRQLERFESNPQAADKLLAVGESPRAEVMEKPQHAAWTMVANMLLNLDETISKQ